jgi:2-dehydro-3-deoxyphosphogluconate aldolase / (4S)-4-hydroxy-2-oxoglutarate aldolase
MNRILEQIALMRILPVVVMEHEDHAERLAETLDGAGLPCAEVTFRTDAAKKVIARMVKAKPSMLVGAGTVLSLDQAKSAVDSGAQFIVSPGLNRTIVEYCQKNNITVIPGTVTPTEIMAAIELQLDVVKFFPAEESGGLNYLKAISAPFRRMKFIPTGGVNEANLLSFLKVPSVLACGGSWMVKQDLVDRGEFDEIRKITIRAVEIVHGTQLSGPKN